MGSPWTCPSCGEEDAVERLGGIDFDDCGEDRAQCAECSALFEVENDYDWTGDGWQDCSTLGGEVRPPPAPEQLRLSQEEFRRCLESWLGLPPEGEPMPWEKAEPEEVARAL